MSRRSRSTDVPPTAHPLPLAQRVPRRRDPPDTRPRRGAAARRQTPRTAASSCRRSWAKRREVAALEIAAAVRAGTTTAREVVEDHLAVIAAREDELHACNPCSRTRRAPRPTRSTPRWRAARTLGPLAGVPGRAQGQHVHTGDPDHVQLEDPRRLEAAVQRDGRRPPARRGRSRHRQDEPRRVRNGVLDRELGVRPNPQPPRSVAVPGGSSGGSAASRSRRGTPRWRSARTPAARSANRRRCAVWSA